MPPERLEASPTDDTTASIVDPVRAKAGSFAVTITAATFATRSWRASIEMPILASRLRRDWIVNWVCCLSPVPRRPTTRP
jgi:hypothetical protein